jgi:hypothetical protein
MNESTRSGPAHAVLSALGYLYLRAAGSATRIRVFNAPAGTAGIYASWHCRLAIMLYVLRDKGIFALVSRSKDGEYVSRMLGKFGFNTVRGSTSRGAARSVLKLIECGLRGFPLAITPDGPRGPKGKVQQGVVYLAQKTGLPILPLGVCLSNRIVFNSWDNFEFPLPFGKAAVIYGEPIKVSENDRLDEKAVELEAVLNSLDERARLLVKN